MTTLLSHAQFITDSAGHKEAAIIPIKSYYELKRELEDLSVVAERMSEPNISHKKVIEELKADGLI